MLRNRIYYGLKPLIPRTIRMEVRRRIALRPRKRATGVWPIMPGSEQRPEGWPGWPDGKKFAFVLTHDVETTVGLERCRDLIQLEIPWVSLLIQFCSRRRYQDPRELREELTQNGFEVGIHDLRHDGRLYQSDKELGGTPLVLIAILMSGDRWDFDRRSCCTSSTGCTS